MYFGSFSLSEHPYLTDLDSLIAQLPLGQRESVDLRDIPLEMAIDTVTKGRQSTFSCNFMPLLPFNTEFARKWSNLYDIQVTEGYRDPIIVTEFMHRFYVQEGNKRVSVLKFLDAPTVTAKVTRLYPGKWNSIESRLYGEFCAFWRVCPLYEIEFSREGSYETLAKMLGQDLVEKWPQKRSTTCATPSYSLNAPTCAPMATIWTLRPPTPCSSTSTCTTKTVCRTRRRISP